MERQLESNLRYFLEFVFWVYRLFGILTMRVFKSNFSEKFRNACDFMVILSEKVYHTNKNEPVWAHLKIFIFRSALS